MASIFSSVRVERPKKTAFSLSHSNAFTSNFGRLTPTCFIDTVPGDKFFLNTRPLVRFSPMLSPPMGRVDVSTVWFAVPYRLLNGKFQKFITGYYQDTAGSSQFLKRPNMCFKFGPRTAGLDNLFNTNVGSRYNLLDYCGIISGVDGQAVANDRIECARVLAFWYVYYEYFVDQNLGYNFPQVPADQIFGSNVPSEVDIRTEDGSKLTVPSILNWEQFTQIILRKSTKYPAVGGYLTIGDCIQQGIDIDLSGISGTVYSYLFLLPNKCWPKDYFTSALPWAQKGNPVTVPVSFPGATATVSTGRFTGTGQLARKPHLTGDIHYNTLIRSEDQVPVVSLGSFTTDSAGHIRTGNNTYLELDNSSSLEAIVSGTVGRQTATFDSASAAFTINDLRNSYALQSWLERNARCGSRYIEQILSHFGVRSSDARLQRPEYLGGFKLPVAVTSTAQTSENGTTPQGNLAGQGISAGVGKQITFFSEEHCLLVCMQYIQPRPYYYQGMSRLLRRREFYDFYFPEFAHLGEQEIKNHEVYYNPNDLTNDDTFGYQSRYSEYKFMNNELHGDFKHDSLRSWLFGVRQFDERPTLSPQFLLTDPDTETSLYSPFPVLKDDFDKLYCETTFDVKALRPMPKYGIPYL